MKTKLAVFFGGRSVEHDVSIVTGLQAIEHVNLEKYEVIPVYLARKWRLVYRGKAVGCIHLSGI